MPWFWDLVQLSAEIPLQLPVSTTLLKQSHNYVFHNNPQHRNLHAWCLGVDSSKNKASLWRWPRELLPSEVINKDQLQVKVGPIWEMVQRKFGGFLHSICGTNLRFFHVSVPRSKQASRSLMVTGGHCWHFGPNMSPYCTKFRPSQVTPQFSHWSSQKFQESSKMKPFCCSQWAHKSTLWAMKDTDLKHILLSKLLFLLALASGKRLSKIHAWVANQVSNLGQWEKVAFFWLYSQKPTSMKRFSKWVSGDYSCSNYHWR